VADLEFNIGEENFRDSTLVKMLNHGDYAGAADQFQRRQFFDPDRPSRPIFVYMYLGIVLGWGLTMTMGAKI
jgi:hypothetical protein